MITEAITVKLVYDRFTVIGPGTSSLVGREFEACDFDESIPDGIYTIVAKIEESEDCQTVTFKVPSTLIAQESLDDLIRVSKLPPIV